MNNFIYHIPTKVIFGKEEHKNVGAIIKSYGFHKVMLHYGGGSIKKTGLYEDVILSLNESGIEYFELSGVQPNPTLSLVHTGVKLCKENKPDLILAVGGGSVIDSAKSIASGALCDFDPWLFQSGEKIITAAIPVATILTISAAGSETSCSCVITNDETGIKRGHSSPFNRPLFSILNPELTYTVSEYQTACGIVDIMMHTLERYITLKNEVSPTDEISEAILKSVIKAGKEAIEHPNSYEARAALMWAGSLSHNDLTGLGKDYFMVSHQIEHEISGKFNHVAHGAGLAVVFPAWAKYAYRYNIPRFVRYAVNVWGILENKSDPEKTALEGILKTESFFASIGMPIRLHELNITEDSFEEMAIKCTNFGGRVLKGYIDYGKVEICDILKLAL